MNNSEETVRYTVCELFDQLKDALNEKKHIEEMNQRYIGKMQEQQDQIAELKVKNEIKNEKIMKLVSIFTCLSSQILCEEPELSDEFYKKFDEFHSVLINIEL